MNGYQYEPLIPEALDTLIAEFVSGWAEARSLDYESWYQGLPIWIVRRRDEARTTKVQIEAITSESVTRLSFTPDAYEDKVFTETGGVRMVERWVAEAADLTKARVQIPMDRLVFLDPDGDGLHFKVTEKAQDAISRALESTWESAQILSFAPQPMRIQYVAPF